MRRKALALLGLWMLGASGPAYAQDPIHVAPVRDYVETNVLPWITDRTIIDALKDHNELNAHLTHPAIAALDAQWRAETASTRRPLIDSVLSSAVSQFLKKRQALSDGVITEIFVIDAKGLSVGESEITSDYWQGDEAKWQKTFLIGPDVMFIDGAERDDSTQMLQSQASMTVSDPVTGQPIGSITVGINLDAL
ncbi:hypothetical protein [Pararhizobium antarcticum]|uniref:Uncharacterized protein n=1 Tax=Pararhizobium antarcticum TaxID=1798805 RepID=A0A657LSY4_9HYPH|nr:hypothetical protein [Pararhizobium antarcticum]OJF91015.1 hypothetical protein AX761_05980 [Rhizobium sp. 58]OJF97622.1 hypothetical protein AX760_16820 [Pararhizobium antarcticum]